MKKENIEETTKKKDKERKIGKEKENRKKE